MHTTNYRSTLIAIAPDSPVSSGEVPPSRGTAPTVAEQQFELISARPYELTSDDVVFAVWADRNDVPEAERGPAREAFFSKGQPCLRSSPLAKRYGWGIHADGEGRVALVAAGSDAYRELVDDPDTAKLPAMRSKRG